VFFKFFYFCFFNELVFEIVEGAVGGGGGDSVVVFSESAKFVMHLCNQTEIPIVLC